MDKLDKLMRTEAKLHWLFLPGATGTAARYDTILQETENFVALPTKGSIVPGWVLIVPKFPLARMADVADEMRKELEELIQWVWDDIEHGFGNAFSFEHGGHRGSKVSCGVDQAHLHIAPLSFDLLEAAKDFSGGTWQNIDKCLVPPPNLTTDEYWFASSGDKTIFKPVDNAQSQFFRKLIAEKSDCSEAWDYKAHDFLENVEQTIRVLGGNG